jgi:hypothetical protein
MSYVKSFLWLFVAVVILSVVLGNNHDKPSVSSSQSAITAPGNDCQATLIDSDGTPPPGTPTIDPQRLCNALEQAENEAACLDDWQPPNADRVNAREFCLEVHRRGCGDPQQDCDRIPSDQTYYHH